LKSCRSYEGGLYAERIRNRTFKVNAQNPVSWSAVGDTTIVLDKDRPLNTALNVSLKMDVSKASKASRVGIANGGYWGIPVRPNTTYRASSYALAERFSGPLKGWPAKMDQMRPLRLTRGRILSWETTYSNGTDAVVIAVPLANNQDKLAEQIDKRLPL
jgi:hypothetical protein